jgi:hypothetical protein
MELNSTSEINSAIYHISYHIFIEDGIYSFISFPANETAKPINQFLLSLQQSDLA